MMMVVVVVKLVAMMTMMTMMMMMMMIDDGDYDYGDCDVVEKDGEEKDIVCYFLTHLSDLQWWIFYIVKEKYLDLHRFLVHLAIWLKDRFLLHYLTCLVGVSLSLSHNSDITRASWCLRSPATRLLVLKLVQPNNRKKHSNTELLVFYNRLSSVMIDVFFSQMVSKSEGFSRSWCDHCDIQDKWINPLRQLTPYGIQYLHQLGSCDGLLPDGTKPYTCTNVDLSSGKSHGIHLRGLS